ncbi:MAG: glycoside hydrolase family 43 protein [Phycisphaerae bacterium]
MKRAAAVAGAVGLAMAMGASGRMTLPFAGEGAVENPLMAGQDPSIVYREGQYHLVQSENTARGAAIYVYTSGRMAGFGEGAGGAGGAEKVCVWRAPSRGPVSRNVWAPELEWIGGRWYIYFAADDGRNENHRMYVLESVGADARGPYVFRGKIADATDRWAIDGAVIQVPRGGHAGGTGLYFVWSGWAGSRNGMQHLYIARMSNPWTIVGERVCISSPDQAWERRSGPWPCYVNEGPAPVVRGGKVVVAYSANGFWSDDYCVGVLTCDVDRLMEAGAWEKSAGPVFAKSDEVFGVGHNCFVKGAEAEAGGGKGEEAWWFVYHGVREPGQGGRNREIYAQRFEWGAGGMPVLGRPVGRGGLAVSRR